MTDAKAKSPAVKWAKIIIPAIVAIIIGCIPAPEALNLAVEQALPAGATAKAGFINGVLVTTADPTNSPLTGAGLVTGAAAMRFIGIFVAVVLWLVLNAFPTWMVVILGMACTIYFCYGDASVSKVSSSVAFAKVLSGFSGSTLWSIIGVFGFAAVISQSGLLKRLALKVLSWFPDTYIGQVAGILISGFVISPMIPSTTAKTAILTPFAQQVANALGYKKDSKGITGIFCSAYMASQFFGNAFYSGSLIVFIILGFTGSQTFDWVSWFLACCIWLVVMVIGSFIAIVTIYNPKRDGDQAVNFEKGFTKKMYAELPAMSTKEKVSAVFLVIAFLGWAFGSNFGMNAGVWAIMIWAVFVMLGYFDGKDFVSNMSWPMVFFIGGILCLASQITTLGIDDWIAPLMAPAFQPFMSNPYLFILILCVLTYLVRLVIVSQAATTTIFFAGCASVAATFGITPWVIVFTVYMSCLVWHFDFSSSQFMTTFGLTKGEMTTHKATIPMNIAYMVINTIACVASVPLWQMLGLM